MLTDSIDSYLTLRRSLGFSLPGAERYLRSYARFAEGRGDTHVQATTAIEWAALARSPSGRKRRLRAVVLFAQHARAEDLGHELPPGDAFGLPSPNQRRLPHIYSHEEIQGLLNAVSRLGPKGSLRPHTFRTLFGLLVATGMRISEALALRIEDVTKDGLVIRKTKFGKSRLLPLHPTTYGALAEYLERRRRSGALSNNVFISHTGQRLIYSAVSEVFIEIKKTLGFRVGPSGNWPRIHDLRHTFAVRSLESSPETAGYAGRHMRALSTYLGHADLVNTYWYLSATPHLMRGIADSCQAFLEGGER